MDKVNGKESPADAALKVFSEKMSEPGPDGIVLTFLVNGEIKNLITINPDGSIVKGEAFTTDDESSLKFWDLIFASFPEWRRNLIENAIAENIVRCAREYELGLRAACAVGLVDSPFDASAPSIMRLRLDNVLRFLSAQVVKK